MPVDSDLTAHDVMTADVETVSPDDEIGEVLTRLARADFNGYPVVENREARSASDGPSGDEPRGGVVVGVVTQGDFVDLFQPSGRTLWIPIGFPPFLETTTYGIDLSWDELDVNIDLVKNAGKPVSEVMTTDVVVVSPDAPLSEVIEKLASDDPDINRLPVVDGGELVGIVTRQDVLRALAG